MTLVAADHSIRQRGALVPMRGHRLMNREYDEAYEILADAFSAVAVSEMLVWTGTADRIRVFVDAGWVTVGGDFDNAGDLGAFTAGEVKNIIIEVTVPTASGSRHEELPLNIGLGV